MPGTSVTLRRQPGPDAKADRIARAIGKTNGVRWKAHLDEAVRAITPFGRADYGTNKLESCFIQLLILIEPGITSNDVMDCLPEDAVFDELAFTNAMSHIGYHSSQLRLPALDIDPRLLPCLFVPAVQDENSAPWIIKSSTVQNGRRLLTVYDSGTREELELEATPELLTSRGTAYFFRKRSATDAESAKQLMADAGHSWFRHTMSRFTPMFWQLSLIGLLLNIFALASPLFVMLVYDRVISTRDTSSMRMLVLGVALAVAMETVLRLMRSRLLSWLTARVHYIVGTEIFKRLMELPPSVSQRASVTAQISRIKSFESVRDFFSGPVFVSTIELPAIIIAVVILLFISPVLTLVPLIGAATFMCVFFTLRHYISVAIKVSATESAIVQRFSVEAIQDREEIRASGLTPIWKTKFREVSGRENAAQSRLVFLSSVGEHIAYVVNVLTGVVALYIGVGLVWSNTITTGMLVAVMILIWRAVSPFYSLCTQIARFEQFRNSVRQINSLMSLATETEARKASARLPTIQGAIEFQNVGLRYSKDSGVIFFGLNAKINPGEVIGICGSMGSGKSSLLKLVQCLVQPHLGKVSIDGLNAQQLSAHELRRQVAYISQTPHVFPGTVAENLRLAKPSASDEELWAALDAVGAAQLVKSMPRGLDNELKVHGRLSELIYRLAFARIALQDARIVLIDELPGNLVNTGIGELLESVLTNPGERRTIIFVSQRIDLLRQADRIIRLKHGTVPLVSTLEAVLESSK